MVKLYEGGAYLVHGTEIVPENESAKVTALTGKTVSKEEAKKGTMAYSILEAHNTSGDMDKLKIRFDPMTSHSWESSRRQKLLVWKNSRSLTC